MSSSTRGKSDRGRILVVDDSPTVLDWLVGVLGGEFDVTTASSCREALATIAVGEFHAVVADFELGDGNGLDLLQQCSAKHERLAGILMTGHKDYADVRAAQKSGSLLVLFKPVEPAQLVGWVKNAVTMAKLADAAKRIRPPSSKWPKRPETDAP
jgi:DNA-binding NtrC family response regulator